MLAPLLDFATVAQLVEQGPLKPKVLGSTPSRRTIQKIPGAGIFWKERIPYIGFFIMSPSPMHFLQPLQAPMKNMETADRPTRM